MRNKRIIDISDNEYISVDKDGKDIYIRGNGRVICFDTWSELIAAIDISKATYCQIDHDYYKKD